jgi:type II secretory pathway component GspD/PulD (secretin)
MKLTALIILLACLHVSAAGYGQSQRISVNFVNSTIKEAFNEIERISEYTVFYRSEDLSVSKSVNKSFEDKSVDKILDDILTGTNLSYSLKNKVIVILPTESSELAAMQQIRTIRGHIKDANGDAVPGASIVVEGTSSGAISDSNGDYEIKVPEGGKVLIVSFIGMETQRISINQRNLIDVEMVASNIGVDEVVVIGYGSQKI